MPIYAIGGFGAPALDASGRQITPYGYGGFSPGAGKPDLSGVPYLSGINLSSVPYMDKITPGVPYMDKINTGNTSTTPTGTMPAAGANPASTLATDVTKSNLAASPFDVQLADLVNATNQAAQQAANRGRLGESGQSIQNQLLTNTAANARGQLPADVLNQIASYGAQRGAAGGFGVDSSNANAAVMRALGLNSQQLQTLAGQQYSRLLADNPSAPIFGMQDLLVTPGTYASAQEAAARRQQEAEQFNAQLAYRYWSDMLNRNRANQGGGGYRSPGISYQVPAGTSLPQSPQTFAPSGYTQTTTAPASTTTTPNYNPYNPIDPFGDYGYGNIPSFSTENPNFNPVFPDYSGGSTTYPEGAPVAPEWYDWDVGESDPWSEFYA